MPLDAALLTTFRSRFEAKEPDPKNFIRRVTRLDVYLTVQDLVEDRRSKGFAWDGIAEDFTALGVNMSVATLKTCFRRARERRRGNSPSRPKPPARRSNRPSAAEQEVQRSAGDPVEVTRPITHVDSLALAPGPLSNPSSVSPPEDADAAPITRPIEAGGSPPPSTDKPAAATALVAVIEARQPCSQDEQAFASTALPLSSPPTETTPGSQGSREESPLVAATSVALADGALELSGARVSENPLPPQTSRRRQTENGSLSERSPHSSSAPLTVGEASSITPRGRHGVTPAGGQRSAAFPIKVEIPHTEL